ncbi:hypothetical protein AUEXF2481DRAFT_337946 [Aureobasidium subglaciale EXF-2481]|uniref:Secreted protein n=1 Tax=Aureobasidium subglaciale (strain EXF-2481) TaxID=1043005 RepID=A0A074YGW3_AURSE|nr:uncharacterized protein AUEXF2481DRAFT_337946 [Aureobasidium subglaciale EXF-2481]KEQ93332.1 hypothetical protein AUEXF2481DRAFT_337946 [Aureobasidium subglaciale EXF-2481]
MFCKLALFTSFASLFLFRAITRRSKLRRSCYERSTCHNQSRLDSLRFTYQLALTETKFNNDVNYKEPPLSLYVHEFDYHDTLSSLTCNVMRAIQTNHH